MSFDCEKCNHVQPNGAKPEKMITKMRNKIYPVRKQDKIIIDQGGSGWEIVKEIQVCQECFLSNEGQNE